MPAAPTLQKFPQEVRKEQRWQDKMLGLGYPPRQAELQRIPHWDTSLSASASRSIQKDSGLWQPGAGILWLLLFWNAG